jgi:L-ascorbate metabolism protein UlaG (beta-lactamase superfamily)
MQITMIGHSTVWIEAEGIKILTDPYFGTWGNPAYGRVAPPARSREAFGDVNLVLVSHNHWDHVDRRFLHALPEAVPVVTPKRAQWMTWLSGAQHPVGLSLWEGKGFGPATVIAVPALHPALAGGFIIQVEGKTIYFAGDTHYDAFMVEIARRFSIDVALMPVTTYRIPMTMGEKAAVRAATALAPKVVIPIHLGIQPRSPLLRTDHTPEGFARRLHEAGLQTEVILLKEGNSWSTDQQGVVE